ncbi:MAG: NAD(P)H-dependent oxidoreductase [Candidatus Omnitrophica bacterium CG1_02_49_16]|nr:MAG: NAD(P)H-dependent oxidoreductase [Candidatus Omnitrophica bacterium CG1_02_49_16]
MFKKVSPKDLVEALKWRYATKVFDSTKKISSSDWKTLEEALILSPSSYGLQPWKFFVITDPATRQKLLPLSWNQKQVTECSHFVVFLGRTEMALADVEKLILVMSQVQKRDKAALDMYRGAIMGDLVNGPRKANITEWVSRQVYIALGNFMTSAAMLGIDTCPMEGLDPIKYDEVLGLKGTGYVTKVACAAGYRLASDKYASLPKVRYSPEELIQKI